jgi:hypothetical protein
VADYTDSKPGLGDVFPDGAIESPWTRTEPLITAVALQNNQLWGLPLVSGMKDPITGRAQVITVDMLQEYIDDAVALAELETSLTIFPLVVEKKLPWDPQDYKSFGYMKLPDRPIATIESLTVNMSNNDDIYVVPLEWVETANLRWGQLNVIPLTIALTNGRPTAIPTTAGGAVLLSVFQNSSMWVPSFWKVRYTAGFPNGAIPKVVNDLIGTIAAMEVLSRLAATYGKSSGSSLSIDGMSQSVSTPGPEIFTKRLKDLEDKRAKLVKKIRNLYHLGMFANNV